MIAYQKTPITQEVVSDVLGLPSRDILFLLDKAGSHKDFAAAFQIAHDVFSLGKNLGFFLEELVQHFRTLFLLKNGVPYKGRDQKKYGQAVKLYRDDQLLQILEILTEAQQTMKFAISEKTALEMLLLRIVRTHQRISIDQLVERLVSLEARLDQPVVEPPPKKVSQPAPKPAPKKAAPPPPQPVGVKEQSHFDTLMRFAAKELSGSFKKES